MKSPTKRAKTARAQRGPASAIVLTERDRSVFILTGLCRYLSSEQIARALFPSADRARRRLRILFNAGYLAVTMLDSTRPNLVSLTSRALALMADFEPDLAPRLRLAPPLRLAGIEHHLAIVDVRLYAAALGEHLGAPLLAWEDAGGDRAQALGLPRYHLRPDAIAEWAAAERSVTLAVEVDRGTEALSSVLTSKLKLYRAVATAKLLDGLWVVVAAGPERLRHIRTLLSELGLLGWARVIDHAHVIARPVRELPDETEDPSHRASSPKAPRR